VRKLDSSLTVDVPRKELDRPSWVRVGVIAAVGFVVGVAWPKLVGVRLGPSAPGESASAVAAAGSSSASARANDTPGTTAAASIAAPSTPTGTGAAAPIASAPVEPKAAASALAVKAGQLATCKTEEGETLKGKACGALAFDAIALPRLRRLASCPSATDADGKLSVLVHLDFAKSRVTADVGKSSTVASPDAFASCLKPAFEAAPLATVAHEHPRYTVSYAVHFTRDKANAAAAASPSAAVKPSTPSVPATPQPSTTTANTTVASTPSTKTGDGTEIVWEVAIVRDAPKTGAVVARLPRGTKLQVGAPQDGWYKVKFDDAPNEGWVYRGAIGK
jgi:hypothetical protein